jgi:hypothetical protein
MAQPVWVTPAGNLGTIAESLYFQRPIEAYDPDGPAITYGLIAGNLPEGVQVTVNGSIEGVPLAYARIKGVPAEVAENVTSSFAIRATSTDGQINDRTFSLTVTGQDIPQFTTPAGSLGTFFDGDVINLSIVFSDQDPGDVAVISVDIGELPPGLRLNPLTGAITGYILPITNLPDDATAGFDSSEFDLYPYSFSTRSINKTYEFTLKITDGKDQNLRTFSMYVVSRDSLTADTTDFTADSDILTADLSPYRTPLITNYPEDGVIGTFRHDNFFAYQIDGLDLDGDPFEFEIEQGDSSDIPPGIAFDRNTGWLTGFFPDQGATELTYNFAITIYKKDDTSIVSTPYAYTMTVIGSIESSVIWLNGTLIAGRPAGDPIYSLGAINNGATSMFAILASNPSGRVLQYKLKPGSYPTTPGQYNLLPQGLQLLSDGSISGRVSFNTFAIDSGTTTFDKDITTRLANNETRFDKAFDFTVIAYSSDGLVSVSRKFRITVDRKYNTPYQGLYIKAMPSHDDRNLVNTLLQNQDIIQPSSIYRPADPYFGIAKNVTFTQAYSLDTATLDEYLLALSKNHFRKKVILGGVKTAQALNADGTVAYEVVYSNIVDTGVNKLGKSPPQSITLPYPVTVQSQPATDYINWFDENFSNGDINEPNVTALNQASSQYLDHAKDLNLLANVGSQMARDWGLAGQPGDSAPRWTGTEYIPNPLQGEPFNWTPSNQCEINEAEPLRYLKFKSQLETVAANYQMIWSEYTVEVVDKTDPDKKKKKTVTSVAPFGFLIEYLDTAYLVLRGTQNEYDGQLDLMSGKVINPIAGFGKGKTHNGFTIGYKGLGPAGETRSAGVPGLSLEAALANTTKTKIKFGGHSLGSAIVTLVTAYAQSLNKFDEIEAYPSASPTVGNANFAKWFNKLEDKNGNKLENTFIRLTNKNDVVPMIPGSYLGFIAVAQEVLFDAPYTASPGQKDAVPKNHQICCCYAYALAHPQDPLNQDNQSGACVFPKGGSAPFALEQHLDNLRLYFGSFSPNPDGTVDQTISTVYPNSLVNMRNQVVDVIGQQSTVLPLWMTTKQTDGRVLGFTKAWVICYTLSGESDRISYNIRTQFGEILNQVNFEVDRYILDNQLTKNWVSYNDSTDSGAWNPSPPLGTTFDVEFDISGLYVSTSLIADATNSAVFDRSLTVNGILVVAAGAVGGQLAVPDEWTKKVGRSYQLLMDSNASGINTTAQQQMIRTLNGAAGTWHAGYQTAQRIGYGGGSEYTPNWLTDIGAASYAGYTDFLDQHAVNDMVWYKNNNGWNGTGTKDIEEVFEHIMHTIHLYGVRGGVEGSVVALNWDSENNPGTYTGTKLFKAMEEAINNGMYDAGASDPYDPQEAGVLMKEYMYLLNWGMWEMSVFWAGESLAPEWNDLMRTPSGILANNPLGHALFEKYFAPVLSKPNFATLNSIFQDNDQGEAGYVATSAVNNATTFDGNSLRFTTPVDMYSKTDEYDKYLVFPKTNILG